MFEQITMRRIWGNEDKRLRTGERVYCEFSKTDKSGKNVTIVLTVEVAALPAGVIKCPRKSVPVIKNWEILQENGIIPQFEVVVVPIENIHGTHHIEFHNGGGGNNF